MLAGRRSRREPGRSRREPEPSRRGSEESASTLAFDEIDAGIGGHAARAVGTRLRGLGETRQLLCITHLPQIAGAADAHFRVEKTGGDPATTAVTRLEGEVIVDEVARMLGASPMGTPVRS